MNQRGATIFIIDDDVSVGRSLKTLLKTNGYKSESFTSAKAFLTVKSLQTVACLLLDLQMPEINGLKLQEDLAARGLEIPIIFISGHGNIPASVRAMKAGAVDFLVKPFSEQNLMNAVALAIAKNKAQQKTHAEILKITRRVGLLSPREREVFRFVAQGLLNKEIAYKMGTVLQTIKVHRGRVMRKMQAKSVTELIHFAQRVGVIPPED